ncbi:MAG: hypothetical protein O2919_00535, partial [Chloroflexi bacterium]|nr:hypothetical protein [Chloroflexota bacterium]
MAEITLPSLGENITEADVLKVLVAEGDRIEIDQPLIEIETEKAALDVPATQAGVVTKIHVTAGQTIQVGAILVTVEAQAAAGAPAAPSEPEAPKATPAEPAAAAPEEPAARPPAPAPPP